MRRVVVAGACALALACGDPNPPARSGWQADTQGVLGVTSGSDLERFFPLVDGHIYHYRTESLGDTPAPAGMLMMKVHRSSATSGELRRPAGTQRFEYGPLGIATTTKSGSPAFLLKSPLDPATRWLGPHGGTTRLAAQEVTVTTQSGTFTGCITTVSGGTFVNGRAGTGTGAGCG